MAWKFAEEIIGEATIAQRRILQQLLRGGCPHDWKRLIRPMRLDEIIRQGLGDALAADRLVGCWTQGLPPFSSVLDMEKKQKKWAEEAERHIALTRRGNPIDGKVHARIMFGCESGEDHDWLQERVAVALSVVADAGIIVVPVVDGLMAGFVDSPCRRAEILVWGG